MKLHSEMFNISENSKMFLKVVVPGKAFVTAESSHYEHIKNTSTSATILIKI